MRAERGSAMVETLLLTSLFVPLLFGIGLVGKYIDLKSASLEAARFAVWERTVWSDPASPWYTGAATKADFAIARETDAYVLAHPSAMLGPETGRDGNPLWVDRRNETLLVGTSMTDELGRPHRMVAVMHLDTQRAPAGNALVDGFASGPLAGADFASAAASVGAELGALVPGCGLGVELEHGFGLGSRNFAVARVSVPARNALREHGEELSFSASAAILSDNWTAPVEATYRQRIDGLTVDELVGCAVAPGRIFSALSLGTNAPLYGEGRVSYPVIEALDPNALPRVAP